VLRIERVSKAFGAVRALEDVSLDFYASEVHGLLGENGAGKSTLMAVVSGFVTPDSGRVVLEGERALPLGRPQAARALGVQMVHQHFMLVPQFTVLENFMLGTLDDLKGGIERGSAEARLQEATDRLGWSLDPHAVTASLTVGQQQRLEIVRALARQARVLVLDEPTAVLSPGEVEDLFRVLRRLRDEGTCIVLIAHKLSEVLSVCDRVSVLRRGRHVATAPIAQVDESVLAAWMVGDVPPSRSPLPPSEGPVRLQADRLRVLGDRGEEAVRGASLTVRSGEVLGIGGVDGNGQLELAEALVGLRAHTGHMKRDGEVGYVPQDRQEHGLALDMSLVENFMIGREGPFWWGPRALRSSAERTAREFDVRYGSLDDPARSLSGGNQQKLVVGRTLSSRPGVIVAHNPTRGLDVRATAAVQAKLIEAAQAGAAVVLVSTDLDELAAVASRMLFIKRGVLYEGGAEAMVR
jgi:simple sugar transport system ATP-binding protein